MTTPVDLCNRALSDIASQSFIASLEEDSPEAAQCALWYNTLRRQLLRTANWGFARRQVALTLLGTQATLDAPWPYLYKYAYPADCLKFRYLICPPQTFNPGDGVSVDVGSAGVIWGQPSRQWRFLINEDVDPDTGALTKTILTNLQNAIGAYTMDVTNCDWMDELFQGALTAALSYKLVNPVTGDVGMRKEFQATAMDAILQARVADGNEGSPTTDHVVDWMAARFVSSLYAVNTYGSSSPGWGNWYFGNDNMSWGM